MVIGELKLFKQERPLTYAEPHQQYETEGARITEGTLLTIQGKTQLPNHHRPCIR